jgi:hypothetical protein
MLVGRDFALDDKMTVMMMAFRGNSLMYNSKYTNFEFVRDEET